MGARPPARVLALAALVAACSKDEPTVREQFNAGSDSVAIAVGGDPVADDPACDAGVACGELHSRVEGLVIGTMTVSPAWGEVGTVHHALAVVGDEWEDLIDEVSVEIVGDRGTQEFSLERDPANAGAWGGDLESMGASGEVRIDTWTFRLFQEVPESEANGTGSS